MTARESSIPLSASYVRWEDPNDKTIAEEGDDSKNYVENSQGVVVYRLGLWIGQPVLRDVGEFCRTKIPAEEPAPATGHPATCNSTF